jgi:hypothetical protein
VNILLFITSFRVSKKSSVGKLVGRWFRLELMNFSIALSPVLVSMLVYIDFASVENSKASYGTIRCLRSLITVAEFFS